MAYISTLSALPSTTASVRIYIFGSGPTYRETTVRHDSTSCLVTRWRIRSYLLAPDTSIEYRVEPHKLANQQSTSVQSQSTYRLLSHVSYSWVSYIGSVIFGDTLSSSFSWLLIVSGSTRLYLHIIPWQTLNCWSMFIAMNRLIFWLIYRYRHFVNRTADVILPTQCRFVTMYIFFSSFISLLDGGRNIRLIIVHLYKFSPKRAITRACHNLTWSMHRSDWYFMLVARFTKCIDVTKAIILRIERTMTNS